MSIRDELQTIYDKRGELTPDLVVAAAKRAGHPLHEHFEWDDSVAGPLYRKHQAREMIRSVRIVYREDEDAEKSVRLYHAVKQPDGSSVYKSANDIAADSFSRTLLLHEMERDWQTLKRRYADFVEFLEMIRNDPDVAA